MKEICPWIKQEHDLHKRFDFVDVDTKNTKNCHQLIDKKKEV